MSNLGKEIEVNSFAFINGLSSRSVPRVITIEDRRYKFVDTGLRYLIQNGQRLIRLFDMTDGHHVYRLRHEDNSWTLVSIKVA